MNAARWSKLGGCGLALPLVLLMLGCRHSATSAARVPVEPTVVAGDPSTNVMIVPIAAAWRKRGGGTDGLPSGIASAQPFPFPDYDQSLVKSVYSRWQSLLKAQPVPAAQGHVAVEFELHEDGSVSRIRRLPSEITPRLEQLCERAILEEAPFPKWTPGMKTEIGSDTRLIRINFDFNAASKGL